MTPPDPSPTPTGELLLLARETEQLGRIADRLRRGRPVVAFLACDDELRPVVLAWLSKASAREIPAAEEESAERLLARMEAAAGSEQVTSLAWRPGDRDAMSTLNLHREKLRRGGAVLVWCSLSDLTAVQAEAQDAFSFRDALVVLEGLRLPSVQVPQGDTPEIELARARYELPAAPFEKALAAAELAKLLIERRRAEEAVQLSSDAIEPILQHRDEGAARGTFAFFEAVMAAGFAVAHQPADAWQLAQATVDDLVFQGVAGEEIALLVALQHPGSPSAVEAAHALLELAGEGASPRFDLHMARLNAALALDTGDVRSFETVVKQQCALAGISEASDEAGVALRMARGELREAQALAVALARAGADSDNGRVIVHLGDTLLRQGEIEALRRLTRGMRPAMRGTPLALDAALLTASVLSATGSKLALEVFRRLIDKAVQDGALHRILRHYVRTLLLFFAARRISAEELTAADRLVHASQPRFPDALDTAPPFYRILLPGLRADLLARVPERRSESLDLARASLDLARTEYPLFVPAAAARLVRSLLLCGRFEEASQALAAADPEAEEAGELATLAGLRAARVVIHARTGATRSDIDAAMSALLDALEASGSARVAATTLLDLARMLPVDGTHPDPLALAAAQAERFAEMPMPAAEELCRETRGDVLLSRGSASEAAACFAAAETRLRHYGLLLRVPLLAMKRARAAA